MGQSHSLHLLAVSGTHTVNQSLGGVKENSVAWLGLYCEVPGDEIKTEDPGLRRSCAYLPWLVLLHLHISMTHYR